MLFFEKPLDVVIDGSFIPPSPSVRVVDHVPHAFGLFPQLVQFEDPALEQRADGGGAL